MRLLLDTHTFLWAITDDSRLSPSARQAFLNPDNTLMLSMASAWEIGIKVGLKKLRIKGRWPDIVKREMSANGIGWLAIEFGHCAKVATLPFHHRDPFDRLMAAQALIERTAVISADDSFEAYGVRRIW
jgi:PIN domain nuclease of toxin-antitoxin system